MSYEVKKVQEEEEEDVRELRSQQTCQQTGALNENHSLKGLANVPASSWNWAPPEYVVLVLKVGLVNAAVLQAERLEAAERGLLEEGLDLPPESAFQMQLVSRMPRTQPACQLQPPARSVTASSSFGVTCSRRSSHRQSAVSDVKVLLCQQPWLLWLLIVDVAVLLARAG